MFFFLEITSYHQLSPASQPYPAIPSYSGRSPTKTSDAPPKRDRGEDVVDVPDDAPDNEHDARSLRPAAKSHGNAWYVWSPSHGPICLDTMVKMHAINTAELSPESETLFVVLHHTVVGRRAQGTDPPASITKLPTCLLHRPARAQKLERLESRSDGKAARVGARQKRAITGRGCSTLLLHDRNYTNSPTTPARSVARVFL